MRDLAQKNYLKRLEIHKHGGIDFGPARRSSSVGWHDHGLTASTAARRWNMMQMSPAEVSSMDTRRSFLKDFAHVSGAFLFFQGCPPMPHPRRKTPVDPPEPLEKQDEDKPQPISPSVRLRAQEKEFRETMEQLFTRVRDLRDELGHVPTAQVFSVNIFKQTQEIEK